MIIVGISVLFKNILHNVLMIALHGWPPPVNDAVCSAKCCLIKPHMEQHRYMHAWKFPRVTGQMREMSLKEHKYTNISTT